MQSCAWHSSAQLVTATVCEDLHNHEDYHVSHGHASVLFSIFQCVQPLAKIFGVDQLLNRARQSNKHKFKYTGISKLIRNHLSIAIWESGNHHI